MRRLKLSEIKVTVIDEAEHIFMAEYPDLYSPFADARSQVVFTISSDDHAMVEDLRTVYDDGIEIIIEDRADIQRAAKTITRYLLKGYPIPDAA